MGGGVGYVEMLYRSNIFILIGGGANPIKPLNKLTIWDDNENNMIGEMTFKTDIIRVKLQPHK